MSRPVRTIALAAALALPAAPSLADTLQIAKSTAVVTDQVSTINPRALPGSDIDYTLMVANPVANALLPVRQVVISDTIPVYARLKVADYGAAGSGPVGFTDGNLLALGLLGSGLAYSFATLASATDGLEFSDGTSWSYVPVADADGYDGKVRAIRVTLTGTQATNSSFRLRYRVRLK